MKKVHIKLINAEHKDLSKYLDDFCDEYNCKLTSNKDTYWGTTTENGYRALLEIKNELRQLNKHIIITEDR